MSTYSIYFSPTGGTKKVMDILSEKLSIKKQFNLAIPDKDYNQYEFQQNDLCLFAVPSFAGRVPAIALKRMEHLEGNGAAAILIVVYGNRDYDDTLLELNQFIETLNFHPFAAIAAVAEHSILRQFATGRPDAADKAELQVFAEKIQNKYQNLYPYLKENIVQVPGNFPYKEFHIVSLTPATSDACSKCGLCAVNCPVEAISQNDPAITDKEKCISCMACLSVCPQKARQINETLLHMLSQKIGPECRTRKKNELFLAK